ncbi:prolyl 4-hydroxylase alpha subunit [Nitzschia inconspicua]|uniref:Prolyl 4-hydroxylase alpha subunit n=1 Tax=Nitzschia inconspicua TaxID=303405 RepID=A0A9K3PK41_9STRA|nr:prolyl 4-hydroxylase alpha subunit [Nitzschia inconspicua]
MMNRSSSSSPALRGTRSFSSMGRSFFLVMLLFCATTITTPFASARKQQRSPPTNKSTSRAIQIINESGSRLEVYWVHPQTREGSLMSSPHVMNGATFPLNSYVGHEFEIRELPSQKTGECKSEDQTCRSVYFAVSENDEQIITIHKDMELEFVDDKIRAKKEAGDLVKECQENAKQLLATDAEKALGMLVKCVEDGVAATLAKANEEVSFQASIRKGMAEFMENYTCTDPDLDTSDSLRDETWTMARDGKPRPVSILLDRPASKIHVIRNFISQAECDAMEASAKPQLHRATVADGKGGSQYSEHRKAMQAGITVDWSKEAKGDHIAILSRRVYDYNNYVLGLDIDEHGQEDLMSIQYFGRGENDTAPDRYTPHCDGDCTGAPHKEGTRMATMVMYCTIPEVGGHTNFRNAGVHVKPEMGSAVYFSYIDPDTLATDNGFTEHSGCPVLVGEKKIVTQWIRRGVDTENPWDSFNTLGIKISEASMSD